MRDFKYKATFESTAKCATDKEQDKFLAVASLAAVKTLLPKNIDYERNYDLLGFAGNGAVINRANKNGHVIDAKTAVAINQDFVFKPMDLEHNRSNIVGVILNTGYTTYGNNKIITEEEVLACEGPFNIAIGGLVFRIVNPEFADLLESSSDSESLLHESVSLSWEVGYNQYYINIGSPNLSEAEVVKDPKQIEELSKFLRMNGGQNELEDGTKIYQYIYGNDVMPLAYGFTTKPAADVKGIVTANDKTNKKEENVIEIISHIQQDNVKDISMKKITSLEQIYALSEADLKDGNVSIANVVEVISEAMKKANEKYTSELSDKENAASLAKATAEALKTSVAELNTKLDKITADAAKKQAEDTFNSRMALVDTEFELTDEDRKSVASDITACGDDDSFDKWLTKFSGYAASKKKPVTKPDAKKADDDNADDKTKAKSKAGKKSDDNDDDDDDKKKGDMKAAIASAVETALKNAETKGVALNTGVTLSAGTLTEQFKTSFSKDGIVLTK